MKLIVICIVLNGLFCKEANSQSLNDTLPLFTLGLSIDENRKYDCVCFGESELDSCASYLVYKTEIEYIDDLGNKDVRTAYVDSLLLCTYKRISKRDSWLRTDYDKNGKIIGSKKVTRSDVVTNGYKKEIEFDEFGDVYGIRYFYPLLEAPSPR